MELGELMGYLNVYGHCVRLGTFVFDARISKIALQSAQDAKRRTALQKANDI